MEYTPKPVTYKIELTQGDLFSYLKLIEIEVSTFCFKGHKLIDSKYDLIREIGKLYERITNPDKKNFFGLPKGEASERTQGKIVDYTKNYIETTEELLALKKYVSILIDLYNQLWEQGHGNPYNFWEQGHGQLDNSKGTKRKENQMARSERYGNRTLEEAEESSKKLWGESRGYYYLAEKEFNEVIHYYESRIHNH